MMAMLAAKRILLVVTGGIAAYKVLELVRRLKDQGAEVRCILTRAGQEFVTPLSLAAISGEKVYQDLFSLTDEAEIGHIRLARDCDLVVVAPATANMLAKMAHGIADDLASAVLLATDKPVMIAPAMNPYMWRNPATQANLATLAARGIRRIGPNSGAMAERGEAGEGRMSEPHEILAAITDRLAGAKPLAGLSAIVTSGPTHEPIDPVRYIANRSSGKQGHAIAAALVEAGAKVTLVSGPSREPDPTGARIVHVETAREMLAAAEAALPADIAVCAAAVADWRVATTASEKLKKSGGAPPGLTLTENPDILATLSIAGPRRPRLVVGFAAETGNVVEQGRAKLKKKGCDWIVANDVSVGTGTFGGDANQVHLIDADGVEDWPRATKAEVAERLVKRIASTLSRRKAGAPVA
jgi:phosphopantothenoylcysteine decarboxylase/phosphopantothenate--cysteine ligase